MKPIRARPHRVLWTSLRSLNLGSGLNGSAIKPHELICHKTICLLDMKRLGCVEGLSETKSGHVLVHMARCSNGNEQGSSWPTPDPPGSPVTPKSLGSKPVLRKRTNEKSSSSCLTPEQAVLWKQAILPHPVSSFCSHHPPSRKFLLGLVLPRCAQAASHSHYYTAVLTLLNIPG